MKLSQKDGQFMPVVICHVHTRSRACLFLVLFESKTPVNTEKFHGPGCVFGVGRHVPLCRRHLSRNGGDVSPAAFTVSDEAKAEIRVSDSAEELQPGNNWLTGGTR